MSELLSYILSYIWLYCCIIWLFSTIISIFVSWKYSNYKEHYIFIICLVLFWYSTSFLFFSLLFFWFPVCWFLFFAIFTFCIIIAYYRSYGSYFRYSNWAYISGDWRRYVWWWKNWNPHWKWIMYSKDWSYFEGIYKNWIQWIWKLYLADSKMLFEWDFGNWTWTWKYRVTYSDWSFYVWDFVNWIREWSWIMCYIIWICSEWEFHENLPIWEHKFYIGLNVYKGIHENWKFSWELELLYDNPLTLDKDFMKAYNKYRKDINLVWKSFSNSNPCPAKGSSRSRKTSLKNSIKSYKNWLAKVDDKMIVEKWVLESLIRIHESLFDFAEKNEKSDDFMLNYIKKYSELINEFLSLFPSILKKNSIDINDLSDYSFGSFYAQFSQIPDYFHEYIDITELLSVYKNKQNMLAVLYTFNNNIFNDMLEEYKILLDRLKNADSYNLSLKEVDKFEKKFWKLHLKKSN